MRRSASQVLQATRTQQQWQQRLRQRRSAFSSTIASSPSSASSTSKIARSSALQAQLSFCCLLCGWETACTSCPLDWYGFDPRKYSRQQQKQQQHSAAPGMRASTNEIADALAILGLPAATAANTTGGGSVRMQQIKAAFRTKALEWHPDCSDHVDAEATFKDIVRAYELLLGSLRPPSMSSAS